MKYEVDPSDLRFTQDSISVKFKAPFDSTRIDDAVDMIVSGEWTASKFARICVVDVDGVLFSMDNRRLWVFRKAALRSITVNLKKDYFSHPRLQHLKGDPGRMEKMASKSFFPKVRGKVRQEKWPIPPALKVERRTLFSLAKENQLSTPVQKVSEVHHLGGVSRISIDGASGETGTSIDIIDIGTEKLRASVVKVGCGASTQDKKHINTIAEAERAQKTITRYTSTDAGLRFPWRDIIVVHPRQRPRHSDSNDEGPAVPHLDPVSRKSVHDTTGESSPSIQILDITTEEVNFQAPPVYHQPLKPATVPAISIEVKDSAQNAVIEGPIEMAETQRTADVHCDEQAPPLQHQSVENDPTVSADLEHDDVQMISIDPMPFLSSSQHWWNSHFASIVDRAWIRVKLAAQTLWSRAKEAVQTIWSYFRSRFTTSTW